MALFLFTFPINFRSRKVCSLYFSIHWADALNPFADDKCKQVAREMLSTANTEKSKKKKTQNSRKASNAYLKSVDGWTKWWTSIWLLIKLFSVFVLLLWLLFNVLDFFFPDFFISKIKFWIQRFRRINSIPQSVYKMAQNVIEMKHEFLSSEYRRQLFFSLSLFAMVESNSLGDDAVLIRRWVLRLVSFIVNVN